jgi:hypothetical protein
VGCVAGATTEQAGASRVTAVEPQLIATATPGTELTPLTAHPHGTAPDASVLPATSPQFGERAQRRAAIHAAAGYRPRTVAVLRNCGIEGGGVGRSRTPAGSVTS